MHRIPQVLTARAELGAVRSAAVAQISEQAAQLARLLDEVEELRSAVNAAAEVLLLYYYTYYTTILLLRILQ